MRQRPQRGFGYGILRYLRGKLCSLPAPQISFNYLGQFDAQLDRATAFRMAKEHHGHLHSPRGKRPHLIEIDGMVIGGVLRFEWRYSAAVHARSTLEALASQFITELQSIIAVCLNPGAAAYTPSDFPLARMTEKKLNRVASLLARSNQKQRSVVQ